VKLKLFNELLFVESGINPRKLDCYKKHWESKSITYFEVSNPGLIKRDYITGNPNKVKISYKEYFEILGVNLNRNMITYDSLYETCFKTINPWGFIGIQIGESALSAIGVYSPKKMFLNDVCLPFYYDYVFENDAWAKGNQFSIVKETSNSKSFICSHCNLWEGEFTGKLGVHSFNDLLNPHIQENVIYEIWKYGLKKLSETLKLEERNITQILHKLRKKFNIGNNVTESSLVAAIHLVGPYKLCDYMLNGSGIADEIGTTIDSYFNKFSGLLVNEIEF